MIKIILKIIITLMAMPLVVVITQILQNQTLGQRNITPYDLFGGIQQIMLVILLLWAVYLGLKLLLIPFKNRKNQMETRLFEKQQTLFTALTVLIAHANGHTLEKVVVPNKKERLTSLSGITIGITIGDEKARDDLYPVMVELIPITSINPTVEQLEGCIALGKAQLHATIMSESITSSPDEIINAAMKWNRSIIKNNEDLITDIQVEITKNPRNVNLDTIQEIIDAQWAIGSGPKK